MNTGERLKKLRKEKGYSQADVAKLLGVGRTTYLKYESGENKPSRKLNELAVLYGVTTDYLLCRTNEPVANSGMAASKRNTNSTDLLDFLFHDEPEFLAKIRSIDIKGKINTPGTIFKLTERQKDRIKDIIRLTVKEAEMNGGHAKTIIKSK